MENRRLFTLEEANHLLPVLQKELVRLSALKKEITAQLEVCESQGIDVKKMFLEESLPEELETIRGQLILMGDEVNDILFVIQEMGVFVKDIEKGLVDFYANMGGKTVFLCWKIGELEISHWHHTNEGFDQRKNLFERGILEEITTVH